MQLFDDTIIGDLLANDLETASIDFGTGVWSPNPKKLSFAGSSEGKYIKWHTFKNLEVKNYIILIYTLKFFLLIASIIFS